jgi:phosphoribosylaminoimidazole-succinocarboxamide synthase
VEKIVTETNLEGLNLFFRGKVRDIYDLGEHLLIVATDRISAFDYVLPTPIPGKGLILTQMTAFWFEKLKDIVPNHLVSVKMEDFPSEAQKYADILDGRTMLVKKGYRINIECVARGWLAGSAWKEYQVYGTAGKIKMPAGLVESSRFPEPIFTPATKSEAGNHDINISEEQMMQNTGTEVGRALKTKTLALYKRAVEYADSRGIIVADTKFEFALHNGKIMLIDEILTPDSSRFWEAKNWEPGKHMPSLDKQFVRDWLEQSGWDKNSPPPELPAHIVEQTSARYQEIYDRLTR